KFSCATPAVRGQPSTVIILENGDAFDRYKVVIPRLVPNSTIVSGQNSLANRAIKRAIRAGFNAFFAKLLTRLLLLLFSIEPAPRSVISSILLSFLSLRLSSSMGAT